jgi:hypothetical protein
MFFVNDVKAVKPFSEKTYMSQIRKVSEIAFTPFTLFTAHV